MTVNLSTQVALDILKSASLLFYDGTGIDLDPTNEADLTGDAIIDRIPMDSDEYEFVNALLLFVRTVHGLLQSTLLSNDLLENE